MSSWFYRWTYLLSIKLNHKETSLFMVTQGTSKQGRNLLIKIFIPKHLQVFSSWPKKWWKPWSLLPVLQEITKAKKKQRVQLLITRIQKTVISYDYKVSLIKSLKLLNIFFIHINYIKTFAFLHDFFETRKNVCYWRHFKWFYCSSSDCQLEDGRAYKNSLIMIISCFTSVKYCLHCTVRGWHQRRWLTIEQMSLCN